MRTTLLVPFLICTGGLFAESANPDPSITEPQTTVSTSMDSPAAVQSNPDRSTNLPKLLLEDAGQIIRSPKRWDRSGWTAAWVSTAAVLGTALILDRPVDHFVAKHANGSSDRMAKSLQQLGSTPSVLLTGGIYLSGVAFKNSEVRATGVDAMMSTALAGLLFTLPVKRLVGRSRPSASKGSLDFHPLSSGASFPSGHATQAFALASVIAEHADRPWVSCVSYGLAGLVCLARVEQRQHFLSDVVAGGLIGTFVGKTVVSHNRAIRSEGRSKVSMSFSPVIEPGASGIRLSMTF